MQLATDRRVFLSWGDNVAPLIDANGAPYSHHYVIFRSGKTTEKATAVGSTKAEVFLDNDVTAASHYKYVVYAAKDKTDEDLTKVEEFSVFTTNTPKVDLIAPSTPTNFKAETLPRAIKWTWGPSQKGAAPVLGYLVEDGNTVQPRGFIWEKGVTRSWKETCKAGANNSYRVRALDTNLNMSEPSNFASGVAEDVELTDSVIYVTDSRQQIISAVVEDVSTTWAGARPAVPKTYTVTDGPLLTARFAGPAQIKSDSRGVLYVNDFNACRVRKIDTSTGLVETFSGGGAGYVDGPALGASFTYVYALGIDNFDQVYVGDQSNFCIRKISGDDTAGWNVTTIIGCPPKSDDLIAHSAGHLGNVDGTGVAVEIEVDSVSIGSFINLGAGAKWYRVATTAAPHGFLTGDSICITGMTNHVVHPYNQPVYAISAPIYVIDAFNFYYVPTGFSGARRSESVETGGVCYLWDSATPNGRLFSAIDYPQGITFDSNNNLYFTQVGNVVRKVTPEGVITTIAGSYRDYYDPDDPALHPAHRDGAGEYARFHQIGDIVCVQNADPELEYLLVADAGNSVIRKVTLDGVVTTVLGQVTIEPEFPADLDGTTATARLSYPTVLALKEDTLWIGEMGWDPDYWGALRRWENDELITVVGSTTPGVPIDGVGEAAIFSSFGGLTTGTKSSTTGSRVSSHTWNILLLICEQLDADYKDGDGNSGHASVSLSQADMDSLEYVFKHDLPALVEDWSAGLCKWRVEVKYPTAPIKTLGTTLVDMSGYAGSNYATGNHYCPYPENIESFYTDYYRKGYHDFVMLYWPNAPSMPLSWIWGIGFLYGEAATGRFGYVVVEPAGGGWTLPQNQVIWLHEFLHPVTSYYTTLGYKMPQFSSDGAEEHGYGTSWAENKRYLSDIMQNNVMEDGVATGISHEAWHHKLRG